MITEDYVSFETAKLLKEKGFDEGCRQYWYKGNIVFSRNEIWNRELDNYEDEGWTAPTLQMAMKWLRKKHILVLPEPKSFTLDGEVATWVYNIWCDDNCEVDADFFDGEPFEKYEDACEAAIKCCLKNLIKNEDEEEESDIPVPKTVDEAISTLEKTLSDEDKEYLLKNGAISMHNSLGRWIRNEWGLWTGSELKDELMNMNKSLNHPDDMSNYIIEEFIKYWNNKL